MMMPDVVGAAAPEVVRSPDPVALAAATGRSADLQRTCLAVLRAEWSRLAVVGLGARAEAVEVAAALAELARACRLAPVRSVSGSDGAAAAALVQELEGAPGAPRTVVALDDPSTDPARLPVLLAADAVLLVVRLGVATGPALAAALELVGRDRVLGCLVVGR